MLEKESGIAREIIVGRGYRTVTIRADLTRLGFSAVQARVPALLLPVWGVTGEICLYQSRSNDPRMVKGKTVKYETPMGSSMALDVHPACRASLSNPSVPLYITEGIKKGDALVSRGCCSIALLGVWNWRGTNQSGGKCSLPDWESVALNGRLVYLVFDSDIMQKPQVYEALRRLREFLEMRGATSKVIYLQSPNSEKVGVDDYLASGASIDDLLSFATPELRPPPRISESESPYERRPEGLFWSKTTRDGSVPTQLTNFLAAITQSLVLDDGVEQQRHLELEGEVNRRRTKFTVSAAQFSAMNWPTTYLGPEAILYAGLSVKDHARVAIQSVSGAIPEHVRYSHFGWRQINNEWVYLHAGGGIGKWGVVPGIEVQVDGPLGRYQLPPPDISLAPAAIQKTLEIMSVAPDRIVMSLLGATFRALLDPCDFSLFVVGPTGNFKTELAALCQQHYGASMDARHLPANWASTANSLETLAFLAKDALLVIDDFAPNGSLADVQRYQATAERILRAQGNRAGRHRLSADARLKSGRPPRGLIVATGEDVPRGQSVRSRIWIIEVGPGDVDKRILSECQRAAAAGTYAQVMASYISWLAPQKEGLAEKLARYKEEIRELLHGRRHARTPSIVADLLLGVKFFASFAVEMGISSPHDAIQLVARAWSALNESSMLQCTLQTTEEPAQHFVGLLAAALSSGRCHVTLPTGDPPDPAEPWGWRRIMVGDGKERLCAQGDHIGWVCGDDVFLLPAPAFAAVQRLGRDNGESLPITLTTLKKRLSERNLLASVDISRNTLTIRKTFGGQQNSVLHLQRQSLYADDSSSDTMRAAEDNSHTKSPQGHVGLSGLSGTERQEPYFCYVCRGRAYWRSVHGSHFCIKCHPPGDEDVVVSAIML